MFYSKLEINSPIPHPSDYKMERDFGALTVFLVGKTRHCIRRKGLISVTIEGTVQCANTVSLTMKILTNISSSIGLL
jgi:hypothetical protein